MNVSLQLVLQPLSTHIHIIITIIIITIIAILLLVTIIITITIIVITLVINAQAAVFYLPTSLSCLVIISAWPCISVRYEMISSHNLIFLIYYIELIFMQN